MTFQTQQTAELLRACGEAVLVDAPQGSGIVSQDRHSELHDRPALPFVDDPRCAAAEQAGNDTFDHRPAVATGAGELHLVGSPLMGQAGRVQQAAELLRGGPFQG